MRSFFKFFLAAFLAIVVFVTVGFFLLLGIVGSLASADNVTVKNNSVLFIDLTKSFADKPSDNPFAQLSGDGELSTPSLYTTIRLIEHAANDDKIKGIYLNATGNASGFANSLALREALEEFKRSDKFIIAYGATITQKAYYVANVADKIYANPIGGLDWRGFSSSLFFVKSALQKIGIEPQIFYAGKFKSATEPFREDRMTDANREQTVAWLNGLYSDLLLTTSGARGIDTALLKKYADEFSIQTTADAVKYNLIDGAKYEDEVKAEIASSIEVADESKISFISIGAYAKSVTLDNFSTNDRVVVIYAQGDIVDGRGMDGTIGGDEYRNIIMKARTNKNTKAIVLRIDSPGGSALASEVIWRELEQAKADGIPVIASMGNVAASGGYYIASGADAIFAEPTTITGSIGVFTIFPNLEPLFSDKLGVKFDGVKTATYADFGSVTRPLTNAERKIFQAQVDTIYHVFTKRVADGRKKEQNLIDSIAQGRVWIGTDALSIGLVDNLGGLEDAIKAAADKAGLDKYVVREFPSPKTLMEIIKSNYGGAVKENVIQKEIGKDLYQHFVYLKQLQQTFGMPQTRMPFNITID